MDLRPTARDLAFTTDFMDKASEFPEMDEARFREVAQKLNFREILQEWAYYLKPFRAASGII